MRMHGRAHAAAAAPRDTGCCWENRWRVLWVSHGGGREGIRLEVCAAHLLLGLAERWEEPDRCSHSSDCVCPSHVLLVSC